MNKNPRDFLMFFCPKHPKRVMSNDENDWGKWLIMSYIKSVLPMPYKRKMGLTAIKSRVSL